MPLYEYKCKKCERLISKVQSITDEPLKTCECKGDLVRLISKTSFVLKGKGWFKDGY
jgi:putative FmdB family regulatory protein